MMVERSSLNEAQRRALTNMVSALFDGAMISVRVQDGGVKYLCFRMGGEALPVIPDGESLEASQNSLFLSGEVFHGGKLSHRTWLGMGQLDELLITLESLGDVRELLTAFQHTASIRAALGVSRDKVISLGDGDGPGASAVADSFSVQADKEFEAYDFGEDCQVVDHDGWTSYVRGTDAEYTKIVYVRFADDESGADTTKVGFTVRFKGDAIDDVAAIEQRRGNEIGQRGRPAAERPRG